MDEFLLGVFYLQVPRPYILETEPNIVYFISLPEERSSEFDTLECRQEIEKVVTPHDEPGYCCGIPDIYSWMSDGRFIPRATIIPGTGLYSYRQTDVGTVCPVNDDTMPELDTEFDFSRFRHDKYGDVLTQVYAYPGASFAGAHVSKGYPEGMWTYSAPLSDGRPYNSNLIHWNYQFAYDEFGMNEHLGNDWLNYVAVHESLHALGHIWDTYRVTVADTPAGEAYFHNAHNYGIMGSQNQSFYLPGFQQAQYRWVPTIWITHDVIGLAVNEAGVPGNKRECYYIGPNGRPGGEFFTLENIGVHPYMRYRSINPTDTILTGIMIIHHCFYKPGLADESVEIYRQRPYYCWVLADGSMPYDDANGTWLHEYGTSPNQGWLYPYGSDHLDRYPSSIPNSRLWDGTDSCIEITNIEGHNSLQLDRLPQNFETDPDYLQSWIDQGNAYGVYTMNVSVGNPLRGDFNLDGVVTEADARILQLNMGRKPGVDTWLVPLDINGDGKIFPIPDRDGDGMISTSERIYDADYRMNHVAGDWLDMNCDGRNDFDPESTGVIDVAVLDADGDGIVDFFDPDGDGVAEKVPAALDADNSREVDELDLPYVGYNFGQKAFIEQWIDTPVIY